MLKQRVIKHYQIRNVYPLIGTIISGILFFFYWDGGLKKFISLFLMILGLIIWWVASITLGKYFSIMPKASGLIQTGIYSKIRNPIYVGVSLTGIGWAVLTQNSLLILLAFATVVSSFVRAKLEEEKLFKKFGKKYLDYKEKTWF